MIKFFSSLTCLWILILLVNQADASEIFLLCNNRNKTVEQTKKDQKGDVLSHAYFLDPYSEFEVLIDERSGTGTLNHAEEYLVYKHPSEIVLQRERLTEVLTNRATKELSRFTVKRDSLKYDIFESWDYSQYSKDGWDMREKTEFSSGTCHIKKLPKGNKI